MSLFRQERARPFGLPRTPFDPRSGTHLGFMPSGVAVVTVVAEGFDALLAEDRDGRRLLVAKPGPLRKSTFDGATVDGLADDGETAEQKVYTSVTVNSRRCALASDASETWRLERHEPYLPGDRLVMFRHHEHDRAITTVAEGELEGIEAGEHLLDWEDANLACRRWWAGNARFFLVTEGDNGLYCEQGDRKVWVAKPPRLARETWDTKTIDGVGYVHVATGQRTASKSGEDDEDQHITPSYVAGQVIRAKRVSLTLDGRIYWWEDVAAGREWATRVAGGGGDEEPPPEE